MPYRRLPNTDAARLKALQLAFQKGKELPPFKLAFSQSAFYRVQSFLPNFERVVRLYKDTCTATIVKNKEYPVSFRKARLYISHFIKVMNMAIARGELNPSNRAFYGIDEADSNVPDITNEAELMKWGEQLIAGETQRMRKGMTPISNPTIAVVKVRYEQFINALHSKSINQKNKIRIQDDVNALRTQADDIILTVWNEVEKSFAALPDDEMREKAAAYGVSYVFRNYEMQRQQTEPGLLTESSGEQAGSSGAQAESSGAQTQSSGERTGSSGERTESSGEQAGSSGEQAQ